jgi:hypothetical protein
MGRARTGKTDVANNLEIARTSCFRVSRRARCSDRLISVPAMNEHTDDHESARNLDLSFSC